MKWLWQKLGVLAWWATLPALMVYLSGGERTRVVIASGQKIVVVKGWLGDGKWTLPGGGLHKGEDPVAGLLREVAEETGIRLAAAQVAPLAFEQYHNRGIHFPCRYFFVELPQEVPLRPQFLEIAAVAWVDRAALNAQSANPDVIAGLRHAAARTA